MNEMQQQSQGIKAGEVSIRRYNIWLYLSCCPQNKQKSKIGRWKRGKKMKKQNTHLVWSVSIPALWYNCNQKKLSSDWGLHLFRWSPTKTKVLLEIALITSSESTAVLVPKYVLEDVKQMQELLFCIRQSSQNSAVVVHRTLTSP